MTKWEKYFTDVAFRTAELSYCQRKKVGTIIVKDKRIISIGYNGTPSKLTKTIIKDCNVCNGTGNLEWTEDNFDICPSCGGTGKIESIISDNNCEEEILICPDCEAKVLKLDNFQYICDNCNRITENPKTKLITRDLVIHAEQNALMFCAKNGISTENCDLYVTASPCIDCAKLIIQAGIKNVYYVEEYRKTDGIELLKKVNINCIKIERNY